MENSQAPSLNMSRYAPGTVLKYTRTVPHSSYNYIKMFSSREGVNRRPLEPQARTIPTELPIHITNRRRKDNLTVLTYTLLVYTWHCPRIIKECKRHSPGEGVLVNTTNMPGIYCRHKKFLVYTRNVPVINVGNSCASQWTK